jgi:hypothetical protein
VTDEEFLADMQDPRILKFVCAGRDGSTVALASVATDLCLVPWISPAYFQAKFPAHYDRGVIYYFSALGEALVANGRLDEAVAVCERLLGGPEVPGACRAEGLAMMGRMFAVTGGHDQAVARFEQAVGLTEDQDPAVAVQVLLEYALASWLTVGPAPSLPLTVRAREVARAGDEQVQLAAESTWAFIALQAGDATGICADNSPSAGDSRQCRPGHENGQCTG